MAALFLRAEKDPARPLYVVDGPVGTDRITVGELSEEASRSAAALAAAGVGAEDIVAVWAPNSPMWLSVLTAAAWRGAAVAAVHPAAGPADLSAALRAVRASVLLYPRAGRRQDSREVLTRAFGPRSMRRGRIGRTRLLELSDLSFSALSRLDGYATQPGPPRMDASAALAVLFTSGSAGTAKAVVLTHGAMLGNAALTAERAGIGPGDTVACPLPLYHSAGMGSGALLALLVGARLWTAPRFDAAEVLAAIERELCTVLVAVPAMLHDVARQASGWQGRISSLRLALVGGAHCDATAWRDAIEALHLRELCPVYGQTECGPTVTCDVVPAAMGPPAHCGRPLPGVEVSIRDMAGREQPTGRDGEIWVRGPTLMRGYLNRDGKLGSPVVGDRLRTGDLGHLDDGGRLTVTGRLRDMIVRGGENIAPREVEAVLRRHPAVMDACVVGVRSERLGEEVGAAVAIRLGQKASADDLLAHCAGELAPFERPVLLVLVDRLPVLPTGKVDRRAVASLVSGRRKAQPSCSCARKPATRR